MKIYIIKVDIKENGKTKASYVDSVWENKQDAVEHIKTCHAKCIFNTEYEPSLIEETLQKHFKWNGKTA